MKGVATLPLQDVQRSIGELQRIKSKACAVTIPPVVGTINLDDPSLIPSAVEEILRWTPSLLHFRRTATRDVELRDQTISAGDKVALWYVSANRDEGQFPDANSFDVTRQPNRHLAFGLGSPHYCLGAHLARLELSVWLEEMLPVLGALELSGEPRRLRSNFFHGVKSLPVRVRAASAPAWS